MKVLLYSSNSLLVKYIYPIVLGLVLGWVVRVIIEYIHAATSYHPDIMYTMIIENKKETCDHNHLIAQKIDQDLQNCRKSCSERKNCKFFFINEDNWCGMYSSCSRRRAPTFAGTTFQKQVACADRMSKQFCWKQRASGFCTDRPIRELCPSTCLHCPITSANDGCKENLHLKCNERCDIENGPFVEFPEIYQVYTKAGNMNSAAWYRSEDGKFAIWKDFDKPIWNIGHTTYLGTRGHSILWKHFVDVEDVCPQHLIGEWHFKKLANVEGNVLTIL